MAKKYFKYILFSLSVFFVFSMSAKATTSCQYDIPTNGKHLYVRYEFTDKWDNNSKMYCCLSDTPTNNQCNQECPGGNKIDYSTHEIGGTSITMPGNDVSKQFSGTVCPKLSYTSEGASVEISKQGKMSTDPTIIYDDVDPNSDTPTSPVVDESRRIITGVKIVGKKDANGNIKVTADGMDCHYVDLKSVKNEVTGIAGADSFVKAMLAASGLNAANVASGALSGGGTCFVESGVTPDILFDDSQMLYALRAETTQDGKTITSYLISRYSTWEELVSSMNENVFVDPTEDDKNEAEYKSLASMCHKTNGDERVKAVLRAIGYAFFVLKILIPIGLIVFGAIDFGKAMMLGDDGAMSKVAKTFIIKIIAAIIIFLAPTIINYVIKIVNGSSTDSTYQDCATCIFEPGNCK